MPVTKQEFEADLAAAEAEDNTKVITIEAITESAKEAKSLMDKIEFMEESMKELSEKLRTLRHETIPNLMGQAQLLQFKMDDGTIISVDDFCSGSLPKDTEKRRAALDLLLAYGADGLIKTGVEAKFDRQQHARAMAIAEELRAKGCAVEVSEGVHPQTLQAFARERIRNGEAIDTEALGLYVGRIARLKLPKKGA